ncbi:MAG: hypothetical protein ACREO4_06190 [Lysobacter sp.]
MSAQVAPAGFVWCGKKGDLSLYLTHVKLDGEGSEDGALYIRNENRPVDTEDPVTGAPTKGCPAYLVPFGDFWIFRPEDTDRGRHHRLGDMVNRLANASVALYGLDVPEYRHRIHDAILEFADDVKNLAPPPELTREQWLAQMSAAGMSLKVDGKQVI